MKQTTLKNKQENKQAWQDLVAHQKQHANINLTELFINDENRYNKFNCQCNGIQLDYSKNLITQDTKQLLLNLAASCKLKQSISAMLQGKHVNNTENRPALHTILRSNKLPANTPSLQVVKNRVDSVQKTIKHLIELSKHGKLLGATNKVITDIVNIGIGGSDLGPQMVCAALTPYHTHNVNVYFIANIDSSNLVDTLASLKAATTLFIISSKSFTTTETLSNAKSAKNWLLQHLPSAVKLARHFIAVTANKNKAQNHEIPFMEIIQIWQWVGGRFSLWSAIGLPIAFAIGYDNYKKLLDGGSMMDEHYQNMPLSQNMPVIMALLEIWYVNFWGTKTHAILPYDYYLRLLPKYLQQLTMESNGKMVDKKGNLLHYSTAPVLWGESGTNGQHSYHQLLHQGTAMIPVDFILPIKSFNPIATHQQQLISHCLSQSRALMLGKNLQQVKQELRQQGVAENKIAILAKHKILPGNRPSNTFLIEKLTPSSLGSLIAAYEHKVYTQSIIWNINAFDQWGVEIGKQMSKEILHNLLYDKQQVFDGSTEALLSIVKKTHSKVA